MLMDTPPHPGPRGPLHNTHPLLRRRQGITARQSYSSCAARLSGRPLPRHTNAWDSCVLKQRPALCTLRVTCLCHPPDLHAWSRPGRQLQDHHPTLDSVAKLVPRAHRCCCLPQVWLWPEPWPRLPGPDDCPAGLQVGCRQATMFQAALSARQPNLTLAVGPHTPTCVVALPPAHPCCCASLFCGNACVTSNSRMMYAFSRDGAVPGAQWWKVVNQRFEAPVNAVRVGSGRCWGEPVRTRRAAGKPTRLSAGLPDNTCAPRSLLCPPCDTHAGVVRRDAVLHHRAANVAQLCRICCDNLHRGHRALRELHQ